nr:uncharacterized protein LOC125419831 isoform X2 [Ziziphus jujuba var. spinosa]XP_048322300.1 uncharacterized protein LOC125419831 isoform X2 [Ziziphus jujuba var. spinosa]
MKQEEEELIHNTTSSSSDSNPWSICLGPIVQDSYFDKCLLSELDFVQIFSQLFIKKHFSAEDKFCYNYIVHWSKVVTSKYSYKLSSTMFSSFEQYYIIGILKTGFISDTFNIFSPSVGFKVGRQGRFKP